MKTHQKSQPFILRHSSSIQQLFIVRGLKLSARKLSLITILLPDLHSLFLQKGLYSQSLANSAAVFTVYVLLFPNQLVDSAWTLCSLLHTCEVTRPTSFPVSPHPLELPKK